MKYNDIVDVAYTIRKNVEKNYELGKSPKWSYYIAKAILNPRKDIPEIKIYNAKKNTGNNLSRQVKKYLYIDMAKRFTNYVETHNQLPNYITIKNKQMRVTDYTYMFSWILVFFGKKGRLPSFVPVNSKLFVKPTEPANEVLAYFEKKTGIKLTCIDDFCDWCKNEVEYEFYFDDQKSNKEVINSKAGNCTDLTAVAVNIAEGLGYEWKTYHVRCNVSATGHIYPLFRKAGVNGGEWFVRDVACISSEEKYCIWCEANNGGRLLAINPQWFLDNLHR